MERSPFQVLVFPFRKNFDSIHYAVFKRKKEGYWQGIAGGGEDKETPLESAKREAWEESGISTESKYIPLDSISTIPVVHVVGGFLWGEDTYVIPEYSFGVEIADEHVDLSHEHCEVKWVDYEEAIQLVKWDSNKNALWELHHRLSKAKIV